MTQLCLVFSFRCNNISELIGFVAQRDSVVLCRNEDAQCIVPLVTLKLFGDSNFPFQSQNNYSVQLSLSFYILLKFLFQHLADLVCVL